MYFYGLEEYFPKNQERLNAYGSGAEIQRIEVSGVSVAIQHDSSSAIWVP
jgi:hypothetical protein